MASIFGRKSKATIKDDSDLPSSAVKVKKSLKSKLSSSFNDLSRLVAKAIRPSSHSNRDEINNPPNSKPRPVRLQEDITSIELEPLTLPICINNSSPFAMCAGSNQTIRIESECDLTKLKVSPGKIADPKPPLNSVAQTETEEVMRQKLLSKVLSGTANFSAKFDEKYELGALLGDGAFGFVFSATMKNTRAEVAVKFIFRSKIFAENWVKDGDETIPAEVATIRKLHHPNIITYIEHIVEKDFVLLITELFGTAWDASNRELDPIKNPGLKFKFREKLINAQGQTGFRRTSCDLFECIDAHSAIPLPVAKHLFAQVLLACDYLKSKNLVHRDIKDENIVVDAQYHIKLIDFGSCSAIPKAREDFFVRYNGTPHFASPEIIKGASYQGPQAEVWFSLANFRAIGVLLYTIIFGENPFQNNKDILAYNGRLYPAKEIDPDLKKLLEAMLCIDIKKRISLDKLLVHPWCALEVSKLKRQYSAQHLIA